jgi:hypothetical protein
MRSVLAILAGIVAIPIIGLIAGRVMLTYAPPAVLSTGVISGGYAATSLFCSQISNIAGGYITGALAPNKRLLHSAILAVISTAIGIWVASKDWHRAPLWYHLAEIALVLPITVAGGWIAERRNKLPNGNS